MKVLPKTRMYKNQKYYLLDVQRSDSNANVAAQIYASRIPDAKYMIFHDTLDKKDYYGVYTTTKVSTVPVRKK